MEADQAAGVTPAGDAAGIPEPTAEDEYLDPCAWYEDLARHHHHDIHGGSQLRAGIMGLIRLLAAARRENEALRSAHAIPCDLIPGHDMLAGPCSCGAWHQGEQVMRSLAETREEYKRASFRLIEVHNELAVVTAERDDLRRRCEAMEREVAQLKTHLGGADTAITQLEMANEALQRDLEITTKMDNAATGIAEHQQKRADALERAGETMATFIRNLRVPQNATEAAWQVSQASHRLVAWDAARAGAGGN